MFSFVIPFRSKKSSRNWEEVSGLLISTVTQLLRQTSPRFSIHIVGNDKPEGGLPTDGRVHWHECVIQRDADLSTAGTRRDRRTKVVQGCFHAAADNPRYIMPVDADDRVHVDLVSFLEESPHAPAWIINSGYVVHLSCQRFYLSEQYSNLTSSSCILDPETTGIPKDFTMEELLKCYWFLGGHQRLKEDFAKRNVPIRNIPFPGGCYLTGYGDNLSNKHFPTKWSQLRRRLKFHVRGKRIGSPLNEKFGAF